MVSLAAGVLLIAVVVLCIIAYKTDEEGFYFFAGILGIAMIFCVVADIHYMRKIATAEIIDQKIAVYEENNAEIEDYIASVVKKYMDFESDTYSSLKDKDAITLVMTFPELKSDALIQEQITVYMSNKSKILSLKEEKINLANARWYVSFG